MHRNCGLNPSSHRLSAEKWRWMSQNRPSKWLTSLSDSDKMLLWRRQHLFYRSICWTKRYFRSPVLCEAAFFKALHLLVLFTNRAYTAPWNICLWPGQQQHPLTWLMPGIEWLNWMIFRLRYDQWLIYVVHETHVSKLKQLMGQGIQRFTMW